MQIKNSSHQFKINKLAKHMRLITKISSRKVNIQVNIIIIISDSATIAFLRPRTSQRFSFQFKNTFSPIQL